jgi:hypothetical protein
VEDWVGDVRLGTGEVSGVLPGTAALDHCNRPNGRGELTPDGYYMRGAGLAYASGGCFRRSGGSVQPGSAEAWVRPRAWGGTLFRAAESNVRNLVSAHYDWQNGELAMELADGTLDGRTVWYRRPYVLEPENWHHVKAVFKSTRLGGQHFVVDGGKVMPQGPPRYGPMTKLVGDLDDQTGGWPRDVTVEDTSDFADQGAFVIDSEIFEYPGKTATSFRQVRRARRYTQARAHTGGTAVQIWGYAAPVAEPIPQVSGRVASDIDANPRARINAPGGGGAPAGIDDADDVIPVDSTGGFQDSGFIWVDRECIYYGSKAAAEFRDCERGMHGTTAAAHGHRRVISAASLRVTNHNGYRLPPAGDFCYVQVDDRNNSDRVEWMAYKQKLIHHNAHYLFPGVTFTGTTPSLNAWRGRLGTSRRGHAKGAKVIPVFKMRGPECGHHDSPQYEPVTVIDNSMRCEARRIKRAYLSSWPQMDGSGNVIGFNHDFRAAFSEFTSRTYSGSECRLLKYPSGELAVSLPNLEVVKGMEGDVDEIRVTAGHTPAGFLPADLTLPAGGGQLVVQMPSRTDAQKVPAAGLVRIDDELVYYTSRAVGKRTLPWTPQMPLITSPPYFDTKDFDVVTLGGVRRAVLGTATATHPPWSPAIFLEAVPVSELSAATVDVIEELPLRSSAGFEDTGYAMVGSEIVGYCRRRGNGLGEALFRGAYGTRPQPHPAGTLVLPLPFRYWDRYLAESDSSELAYFQGSHSAAGTRWNRIGLVVDPAPHVTLRLQVRFDGAPGWDTEPTNRPGELYEFEGAGPHELRDAAGRPVRADQIEYRILFEYWTGAYLGNGWKQTPLVDTLYIEYGSPLVVLRREVSIR